MKEESRYHAEFYYQRMELEGDFDDLSAARKWIADHLAEFPNPALAVIADTVREKIIFKEINPE